MGVGLVLLCLPLRKNPGNPEVRVCHKQNQKGRRVVGLCLRSPGLGGLVRCFPGGSIAALVLLLLGLVVGLSVVLCEVGFVMLSVVSVWVSVFSSMWCLKVEAFGFAMCGVSLWMFGCSSGAVM